MTDPAIFAKLSKWSLDHEAIYGFKARLVHDDSLQLGEIVYRDHEVRMSRDTRREAEEWADKREPPRWSP